MTVNCESQLAHRFTESGLMSVGGVRPILAPSPDAPAAAPLDATATLSSHVADNDGWGWIGETRNEDLRRVWNQIKFIHLTRPLATFWNYLPIPSWRQTGRQSRPLSPPVYCSDKAQSSNFIHFIRKSLRNGKCQDLV